jgi:cytosine/adenosine deaminase-related metal-dependent hydrolase
MNSLTRRFSANYVYTNTGEPIQNGVVGINDTGVVVEIINQKDGTREYSRTLFLNGVIIPGFVNSPILSDLPNLIGKLPKDEELATFLSAIKSQTPESEVAVYWQSLLTFNQIQIILSHFPGLSFGEVLRWATLEGAKALGLESKLGSIELGKKPGLSLITPFDFIGMKPMGSSRVRRLV